MKKTIHAVIAVMFFVSGAFAQCIIDTSVTHNVPGTYPDTIQNLPHAIVGTPYSTVMQLNVKPDTNIIYLGFPVHACIDSIVINNVSGLPVGYTFDCTPASCAFPGGGNGCILLQGPAPTLPEVGMVYPITVNVTAYGVVCLGTLHQSVSDVITGYKIVVDNNTGIPGIASPAFDVLQNVPNPFHGISEISYSSPKSEMVNFKISNLLGKVVYERTISAQRGLNKIALYSRDFEAGIYIYTLSNSRGSVTKRMIVSNE